MALQLALQSFNAIIREPLVQFLVIGVLLFVIDRIVFLQRDDPREIIVTPVDINRLVEVFTEGQGRPPTPGEVDELLVKWGQNEVFYREALAMGLDQGDEMMRSRLILKMRNVIFNRVVDRSSNDNELREWFALNQENYAQPARYTLERVALESTTHEAGARALAAEFSARGLPEAQGQRVRRYPRRSAATIDTLFTEQVTEVLLAAPQGQWVPVLAGDAWSLLRVVEIEQATPASFEEARNQVAKDFAKAASGLQMSEMAGAIAAKYRIHFEFDEAHIEQAIADASHFDPPEITAQSRSLKARAGVARAGSD